MPISVLMTVFNGQQWLNEAIRSVLDQTYSDFEFVIVDDGSTDATPDILRRATRLDSRIRIVSHENMGVSRSVNAVLPELQHEWVARFDADDLMMPQRLERQAAFLAENPDVAVASCLADYIDADGDTVGRYDNPLTSRDEVRAWIEAGRVIHFIQSGAIMRRDVVEQVGGYRPEFSVTEDTDLWNRVAEAGFTVLVQPEVLMQVRVHAGSLTRSSLMLQAQQFRWLEEGARQRRAGQPEVSFEAFLEREREANPFRRLNTLRRDYGQVLYKRAAVARTQGAFTSMLAQLGMAMVLYPSHAIGNVWSKSIHSAGSRGASTEVSRQAEDMVERPADDRKDQAA